MRKEEVLARSRAQLRVLRVVPHHPCEVELLSDELIWAGTHWIDGRQWLCAGGEEGGCPGCACQGSRLVGLTVVGLMVRGRVIPHLLETSALSWSRLEGLARMEGLRVAPGLVVNVSRSRSRAGLRLEPTGLVADVVPFSEGQLVDAFAVLFGLPLSQGGESADDWAARVGPVMASFVAQALERQARVGQSSKANACA